MNHIVRPSRMSVKNLVKISMLAVMAFLLMFVDFPLPFAPPFMTLDVSDLPAMIGGFALGPIPGVLIVVLKNILNVLFEGSKTGYVGELSNAIVGSIFIFTAATIYERKKTFRRAIAAMIVGVLVMSFCATFSNYFFIFPLYAKVFGLELDKLVEMGSAVNGFVTDYKTMMVFVVVPFNITKGTVVSLLSTLIYKRVSPILKR